MEKINTQRRNFLKWLGFGVGAFIAFVLGKIFGPSAHFSTRSQSLAKGNALKNFRIKESKEELTFYNNIGDEIFIIEKESRNL